MEKILIVDDEAFIRENLERILTEDGYRPFSTESPEDAVRQVSEEDLDLVFSISISGRPAVSMSCGR